MRKSKIQAITALEANKGLTTKQAIKAVYPDTKPSSLDAMVTQVRLNPAYSSELEQAYTRAGLPKDVLIGKMKAITECDKAIVVGRRVEYVPDNVARFNATKDCLDRLGVGGSGINIDNRHINVYSMGEQDIERLKSIADRLERTARDMAQEERTYDAIVIDPKTEPKP